MPLEAELLASKVGGQLLRRLQFSHWRQHRDSWARQHENARNTRLAFAELLGDEPRSKPAVAKPAATAAAKPAAAAAAATLAPAAAAEAPLARARPARQARDSGAEAAVGEAPLGREEEEELDNLFDAPPVRSKPKQQRKLPPPPPPPPPPPSAAATAAAAAAARLRPAGKASAPAGLQPLERPAKAVKSHKGAGQGAARGFTGAADGAPKKRRKGNKGEAEGGSDKPSRAERLASAFAVGQAAGGKRKFAMS